MTAPDSTTFKVCSKCREEKPLEAFTREGSWTERRKSWCKACACRHAKDRYARLKAEWRAEYYSPPPGVQGPDTQILDDDGRDWSWAFVIFRLIPDFPLYLAGSDGSVWSNLAKGPAENRVGWHRMGQALTSQKYYSVKLRQDNRSRTALVHALIASTFRGLPGPGMHCRHLNGDKTDCRLFNLVWGTRSQNERDKVDHGRSNHGERNGMAKLTEVDAQEIRRLVREGWSNSRLAKSFNVSTGTISRVRNNLGWTHGIQDTENAHAEP